MAVLQRSELKSKIDAIVKSNKKKEITGPKLNEVLTDLLDSIFVAEDTVIIIKSSGDNGHFFKFTCDDTGMLSQPGEDLGA